MPSATTIRAVLEHGVCVLCFMSHQQLRSYGDGATASSFIRQTGEAGDQIKDPWFTR